MPEFDPASQLHGVVLRTISGYWDGPWKGLAEYHGRLWWYEVVPFDVDTQDRPWRFHLYEISEADLARERATNDLFVRYVGTHVDLNDDGSRNWDGVMRPESEHAKFYDADLAKDLKERRQARKGPPVGWFDVDPKQFRGADR